MIKSVSLLIIAFTAAASAQDSPDAYQLQVTRDGVKQTRVAYNFWSDEYPGPVANVTQKITLNAFKSLRELNDSVSCTVKEGIYHPWSNTENAIINYYTLTGVKNYKATEAIIIEDAYTTETPGVTFKKSDQIINTFYLAEGSCLGTLVSGESKKSIEYSCNIVKEAPFISTLQQDDDFHEQWVHLQCEEGHKAFIQDKALMKSPKVKAGQIYDYGEVGE